jgi:hypothetical protein
LKFKIFEIWIQKKMSIKRKRMDIFFYNEYQALFLEKREVLEKIKTYVSYVSMCSKKKCQKCVLY